MAKTTINGDIRELSPKRHLHPPPFAAATLSLRDRAGGEGDFEIASNIPVDRGLRHDNLENTRRAQGYRDREQIPGLPYCLN